MAGESTLELLFKIRADFEGEDRVLEDVKALADAFGKPGQAIDQLTHKSSELFEVLQGKGLEVLDQQVEKLSEEIPIVGPAISKLSSSLIELGESGGGIRALQDDLAQIGQASGHSSGEVTKFLSGLDNIADIGEKADHVLKFLGENLATKVGPLLETAAKASQTFGDGVINAGKALGKSDEEINKFVSSLVLAETKTEAVAKLVGFFGEETAKKLAPSMLAATKSIENIGTALEKFGVKLPVGQISTIVGEFASLGSAAEKNSFAVARFGEEVAKVVGPQLENAAKSLSSATGTTLAFVEAINSAATALGPFGIAIGAVVIGLAAFVAGTLIAIEVVKKIGEALFETAENTAQWQNALYNVAQQTSVNVETLSSLELALSGAGVSVQGLSQAIIQFQRQLEASKDLTSDQAELFKQLGVTSRDTETAFKQTLKGLAALGEGTKQTTIAMQLFGRTGKSLINVLKETDGDIDAVIKRAHELGIALGDEQAEKAHKFTEALDALELQFRAMFGDDLIPIFTEQMEDLSQVLIDNQDAIKGANSLLTIFATVFVKLVRPYIDGAVLALKLFNIQVETFNKLIAIPVALLTPFANQVKHLGEEFDKAVGVTKDHTAATEKNTKAQSENSAQTKDVAASSAERAQAISKEITFLESLVGKDKLNAEENAELEETYKSLSKEVQKHIKGIENERDRIYELIKAKKEQKQQNEEEAADEQRQRKIAQEKFNIGPITAQANATIENAKRVEDQAKRDFEVGKKRATELRDVRIAAAKTELEQTKLILEETNKLKQHELEEAKAKAVRGLQPTQNIEAAQEDARIKHLLGVQKAEAEFRDKEKKAREDFDKERLSDQRAAGQRELGLLQDKLNLQRKLLEDQLKRNAELVKNFVAEPDTGIAATRNLKSQIEIALKRSDLTVAKRKELNAQLAKLDQEEINLDKQHSKESIDLLITSNADQRRIAEDSIKISEDELLKKKEIFLRSQLNTGSQEERKTAAADFAKFEIEKTETLHNQEERRRQIEIDARNQRIAILVSTATATNQLIQQTAQENIEGFKRQASEELISHQTAAEKIIKIKKDQIQSQLDLNEVERKAAVATIEDAPQLAQRIKELADQRDELVEQRKTVERNAVTEIEAARQEDIDNERAYQEELENLQDRVLRAREDAARTTIAILQATGVKRITILTEQVSLEQQQEDKRHKNRKAELNREKDILDERLSFLKTYIQILEDNFQTETDTYIKANEELAKANAKRAELQKESQQEDLTHVNRGKVINRPLKVEQERENPLSDRSLLGDTFADKKSGIITQLDEASKHASDFAINLKAAGETAADFFQKRSDEAGNLADIAGAAFDSLANAVGSLVQNYVLMGTTGPAAMRKILAATLAQVAGQATVKAIYELAEGFALLAIGDFGGAGHAFLSAGLYASIAGGSAIAGRKLAGNLFSGKGGAAAGATSNSPTELNPIVLGRNQPQPQTVRHEHVLRVESNDAHIVKVIGNNWRESGELRELVLGDGG